MVQPILFLYEIDFCLKQTGHQSLSVSFCEAVYSCLQLLVCEQAYVNCCSLVNLPFWEAEVVY